MSGSGLEVSGGNSTISEMQQCFAEGTELVRIAKEALAHGDRINAMRMYALADVQFARDNELSGNAISYEEGTIAWLI